MAHDEARAIQMSDQIVGRQPYGDKPRVRRDARTLIGAPELHLTADESPFEGHQLLRLHGTMVTVHRGSRYNTPITLMFPLAYPAKGPVVHITCGAGLQFAPNHENVRASDGRVFHSTLSGFSARSDIGMAIMMLQSAFGHTPPLHAAPARAQPAAHAARPVRAAATVATGRRAPTIVRAEIARGPSPADLAKNAAAAKRTEVALALARDFNTLHAAATSALEAGKQQHNALQLGRQQLEIMEQTQRHRRRALEQRIAADGESESNVERRLTEASTRCAEDVPAEELVKATDVYSEQLLEKLAAAAAYTDVLDKLVDAAKDGEGAASLDDLVKYGQKYSKKVFRARALALKVSAELQRLRTEER
jgi:hypothetical protein